MNITKAISQAKVGTPDFLEAMENLLYSKQSIPCIFLKCLETSARSRQVSKVESTDRDVDGICAIHPFQEDLTRVESSSSYSPFIVDVKGQQLSTISAGQPFEDVPIIPSSGRPLQSIANWDLRRASETQVLTKVSGINSTPISRNSERKHRGGS